MSTVPVAVESVPANEFERFLATLSEPLREEIQTRLSGSGLSPNHPVFTALADFYEKNIPKIGYIPALHPPRFFCRASGGLPQPGSLVSMASLVNASEFSAMNLPMPLRLISNFQDSVLATGSMAFKNDGTGCGPYFDWLA